MPGTLDDCVSPTPTMSSSGDGLQDSSRDFKDYNGIRSWSRNSRSSSALDRHSESSESLDNQSTSSGNGRQMHDFTGSSEFIPTRSTKTAPKVAYNPMQFVKTGPTKLAQTAQEQLKKAEEVKKIREKKKDDAEDWQSNLEGWKSSRRKRQEHVIERVTEVKRMEQEEALKASEAATKRLIGIREKRGKLSALYSVEDNDEIEFDSVNDDLVSSSSSTFDQKSDESSKPTDPNNGTTTTTTTYNAYDKSIDDYVKFSTAALQQHSKQQQEMATETSVATTEKNVVAQVEEPVVVDKPQDNTPELVVKRRSVFEAASAEDKAAAANRRSGEFSSTFKNRLSTFEVTETSSSASSQKVTPDRDPQFKNKLATFHKVASNDSMSSQSKTTTTVSVVDDDSQEEKPDFKAKLAAFRQVEEAASVKPLAAKPTVAKPTITAAKPAVKSNLVAAAAAAPSGSRSVVEEPIYANSSVAMASSRQPPMAYSPPASGGGGGDAESSDCTEDEGIRSLSPHGTPSPTSPTRTEAPEHLPAPPPPLPAHPPVGYSPFSFQQQQKETIHQTESVVAIAESSGLPSTSTKWPPAEVVWDESWVELGAVQNAAPPSEKPPPPPICDVEDALLHQSTSMTCTTSITSTTTTSSSQATTIQQVTRRNVNERNGELRQELRKRRSDFLGFDVNAMEDDAKEMADAIPPPPDLKSLLRNTTDYRTVADLGLADWQPQKSQEDESELARKEREIIETLEKEEQERMKGDTDHPHNRSRDGAEYEMTAEIDQLAREWQNDAILGPGWRSSAKFQAFTASERASLEESSSSSSLHVDVNNSPAESRPDSSSSSSLLLSPPNKQQQKQQQHQQQMSPPKPSRLSAAPKPRLHDGEAWMAKRKVASEGGPRKDMKDVSRHWLIQEAEQRRIDAMQERRNYSPSSSSSLQLTPPGRLHQPVNNNINNIQQQQQQQQADGSHWMSRSSSSTSMDKMSELRLPKDQSSRSTSSLGSSPTPRPLYANQEEILEYADFTGAPHTAPPVWQVRSLVNSGSMDQLQAIHSVPPSRPAKSQSQTLPSSSQQQQQQQQYLQQQSPNPAQTQPSWRSTHPPETEKEAIAPLPHSVITTLTRRMTQRNGGGPANNNNSANYGDYMNVQEATQQATQSSRAGPQVPAQKPANYRHPGSGPTSHSVPLQTSNQPVQSANNNNDRMLSVSGKKKCSLCQEELGRGAAMIIESLRLFYHINCFRCCVCGIALGNGTAGTDVRVRNNNLHCHDCYSNDDGLKFSKV